MDTQPQPPARYDDLKALFINCTLSPSPKFSHTGLLMEQARTLMTNQSVQVETVRLVDHQVAPGLKPDMTEDGSFERDDWPALFEKVRRCDILVVASPVWLGERSSVCSRLMERLNAHSSQTNDKGQQIYYGRVAGSLVTGNEDGAKTVARSVLYGLQHIGFTVPPQADAYWVGEAGPGPSYGDETDLGVTGVDHSFTQKNTTFMCWNLLHMARLLKDSGGVPAHGNQPELWNKGYRFGHPQ